jgi:hypothetical protein
MSETVLILGAGASKEAGAPIMRDFLDVADDLLKGNHVEKARAEFDLVFRAINSLQAVHSKAQMDLQNIESVFAALEMARLVGKLDGLSSDEVQRLPEAMVCLIQATIEKKLSFPIKGGKPFPPSPFDKLAKIIQKLAPGNSAQVRKKFSIITFNYDLCVDVAFQRFGIPIDYGLEAEDKELGIKVSKLHGSLNWARCPRCKKIAAWKLGQYLSNRIWQSFGESERGTISIASNLGDFPHCGAFGASGLYLVPPTWNKAQHHEQLQSVWSSAAAELADAENIFVCGYSLPDTDHFFPYLYALGSIGGTRFKRFWVFDPNRDVENRFRKLLGPVTVSRFAFHPEAFTGALRAIESELAST